ncbi:MAG: TlpA family protein disulfide reductase [Sphingobacteriales bacterium]|nr:TlpA family protein disulfide reductase [Sphingobacteriales bacterium]
MKRRFIPVFLVIAIANVLYFVVFNHKQLPLDKTVLYDEQNQVVTPDKYKNTVRIFSFFQTWCGDCRREMDDLKKLQLRFNGQLKIIMISDESFGLVNEMKRYLNVEFIFLRSETKLKEMGIRRYPTTFLLDKDGKVILVKKEGKDWYSEKMINKMEQLLR